MIAPILHSSTKKSNSSSTANATAARAESSKSPHQKEFKELLNSEKDCAIAPKKRSRSVNPSALPKQMIRRLKQLQDLAPKLNCIVAQLGPLEIKAFAPDEECPYYSFEFYGTLSSADDSFGYEYTEAEAALLITLFERAGIERRGRSLFRPEFDRRLAKARAILSEQGVAQ